MVKERIDACKETLAICDSTESYRKKYPTNNFIQDPSPTDVAMMRLGHLTFQLKEEISFLERIQNYIENLEKQNSILSGYLTGEQYADYEEKIKGVN